jgi:NAD(P)-dependent dehydrogenase (short-subunit alcohol dehydrogenase family)
MSVKDQVVLIAGGGGGLGQAVTPAFSEVGATVVHVERQVPPNLPEGQLALVADVTDEADVRRVVAEAIRQAGRVDCVVNLVGAFALGRVADTDVSLWNRMLALNLTAPFLLSRAIVPHMVARGSGRILHIAARAALDPFPGAAAYLIAKSGLAAMIRVLALELAGTGVTVNGVLPTTIDTPANRKGMPGADPSKWVKPASIAQLLLFLASHEANEINGALIPIGPL